MSCQYTGTSMLYFTLVDRMLYFKPVQAAVSITLGGGGRQRVLLAVRLDLPPNRLVRNQPAVNRLPRQRRGAVRCLVRHHLMRVACADSKPARPQPERSPNRMVRISGGVVAHGTSVRCRRARRFGRRTRRQGQPSSRTRSGCKPKHTAQVTKASH